MSGMPPEKAQQGVKKGGRGVALSEKAAVRWRHGWSNGARTQAGVAGYTQKGQGQGQGKARLV